MKPRVVCPHCKAQGRLIRLVVGGDGRLECTRCNRAYTMEEVITIYENIARAYAEVAGDLRRTYDRRA